MTSYRKPQTFQAIWVIKLWILIIHIFILRLSFSTNIDSFCRAMVYTFTENCTSVGWCFVLQVWWLCRSLLFCPRMRNQDGAIIGDVFRNQFWSLRDWWHELGELLCVSVPLTKECWLFQFAPDRLTLPPNVFPRLLEVWHDWRG